MWYLYLIQSAANGKIYTGISTDPLTRLVAHNSGKKGAKATRAGRPWTLAYIEEVGTKSAALRREAKVKTLGRDQKLTLIASGQRPNF